MSTAKIVLPNFYKLILYTDANELLTTHDGRLLAPSEFGSYLSFEIMNTTDGKFRLRTREIDGGIYVAYSDEGLYLTHDTSHQFELHLQTHDSTLALLSCSPNGTSKSRSTGSVVYASLNPPLKI
ncbi:hypothetical protein E3P99_00359 [Wallemia hederae]|uniref:Uncharacterized protein n=1 Tax=Wallemia hederae TaxID=1540922 RepID=A0A4T0FVM7_9BASI|nr:hypothetical protein E3P99_00359 [Wallemia hederae]